MNPGRPQPDDKKLLDESQTFDGKRDVLAQFFPEDLKEKLAEYFQQAKAA